MARSSLQRQMDADGDVAWGQGQRLPCSLGGQGQRLPCSLGMKSRGPAPPDGGQEILLGRPPRRRNLCPSPSITLAFEASKQPLPLGVLMGSWLLIPLLFTYFVKDGDLICVAK